MNKNKTKDKLSALLKEYDRSLGSGEFSSTAEFKQKFFEAAEDATTIADAKSKPVLRLIVAVSAIAAAVVFVLVPLNTVTDVPVERVNRVVAAGTRKLMLRLKKVFPERNVGLCLINGELKTFESDEKTPRNILVSYSLQRASDGKEIELAIATSSNNSANLDSSQAKGSIWVYQPDNTVLNVDTDLALKLDAKTTIKINESNLLKLNEKQFISEFEYRGHKYKLFQSACRI